MIAAPRDGIWGTESGTCGRSILVRRRDDGAIAIMPALCDTWACKLCGPRKAAWFKRQLTSEQLRLNLNTFITLTVDTKSCTAEESSRLITLWWDNLHRQLEKAHGKFSYIWVHELTEAGYSHLHLLTSLELQATELSSRWQRVTGSSFIVDVQPVISSRAADYLAKYCTEQATLRAEPAYRHLRGRRFYSKSRDVQFAPFRTQAEQLPDVDGWRHLNVPYNDMLHKLRAAGVEPVQRLAVVPSCLAPDGDYDLARLLQGHSEAPGCTEPDSAEQRGGRS